jgi:hypothetical protein
MTKHGTECSRWRSLLHGCYTPTPTWVVLEPVTSAVSTLNVCGRTACCAALSLVAQRANGDERGGVPTSGAGCASIWPPRSWPGVTQWGRETERRLLRSCPYLFLARVY